MKKLSIIFIFISLFSNAQLNEKIDRELLALSVNENTIYVGWHFLIEDLEDVAFNIYRRDIGLGNKKLRSIVNVNANSIGETGRVISLLAGNCPDKLVEVLGPPDPSLCFDSV